MPGLYRVRVAILAGSRNQSRTGDPIGGEINNFHRAVKN